MQYKTVLFDLDGTLIDTNELIHESYVHTTKKFGYDFSREELLQFNGPPLQDVFIGINPEQAEEMVETYLEHNHQHHDAYVQAFPHVVEVLERLTAKGIKLAIVSSKRRTGVNMGLKVTGLDRFFEEIVAVDDVENAKPNPESVIKAMNALGGSPETTIMIGDNHHDIIAGQRAGVNTVAVAWSLKDEVFLRSLNPTHMIKDMRELITIIGV